MAPPGGGKVSPVRPQAAALPRVDRPAMLGVGVMVWLGSEVMFFAGLFATYFTLRAGRGPWPPSGVHLETVAATAFTAILVASSATCQAAVRAAERGDLRGLRRWLALTVALGSVFLANQVREFGSLDFGIASHPYGSIYTLMTGIHGLHVLGGIALMVVVALRAMRPDAGDHVAAATSAAYYWHFVDAVWIGLFLTLFVVR